MTNRYRKSAIALLALPTLALSGCHSADTDPRAEPPLVRVIAPVQAGDAAHQFTGVVAARVQSDLGFRVGGKVTERLVQAGQHVRRGQPLMRIDLTDLALATRAAQDNVQAAAARANQTAADERRLRDLVAAGAISASAYDQAKAAADAARAQLSAAQAQSSVSRNAANYGVLLADADGTVAETLAEPGQVVGAGQIVLRLAHSGPREALVHLPETLRPAIGSSAMARLYDGAHGTATLRQLSDAADPASRTFEARYVLSGAPVKAPLGATVTISFSQQTHAGSAQVPLSALRDIGKGPGVWVLRAGAQPAVTWRAVHIATLAEETATIDAGLRQGERIVAMGAHKLHEGQPVRVAAQ
ncbi:efflux RND transporter periplasmic adaptor subunit [Novosphingobium umbonatum]|uniref:efflux RND transporter periplasmic adaptor subunit n=1 Tax=Novosphingobium umbonatum TaxID=1908524 RepID=UPI001FE7AB10|nr:efflux RND transporter periplasmic adaptor subunit [Novosphingobium umbonatum]